MAEESKVGAVAEAEAGDSPEDVAVPRAAKVPSEALEVAAQASASPIAEQPAHLASEPPERPSDQPRQSLVPLPEGYAPKKKSSNPPRRASDPVRPRLASDPAARRSRPSQPEGRRRGDGSKTMPEAAIAQEGARQSKPGVVMPMRIIDVKPITGNPPPPVQGAPAAAPTRPAPQATPVQAAGVAPQPPPRPPPVPVAGPSPEDLASAPPPLPVQPPPVPATRPSAEVAAVQTDAVDGPLAGESPPPGAATPAVQPPPPPSRATTPEQLPSETPINPVVQAELAPAERATAPDTAPLPGSDAPTPPDTPAAGRATVVSGADAPTPPETPAMRRELAKSLQAQANAEAAGERIEPPPLNKVPPAPPSRAKRDDEEEIDVTVELHDGLEEELTEVEAISEREPEAPRKKKRRLPPRPPPRTTFTDGSGEDGKRRQWFEELWSDDFLRAELEPGPKEIHDEVNFIETSLAVDRGGVVLDLACGAGAHSVEMSRRGYQVVGYDLSVTQLARAGELAQRNEQKISYLQGDVRDMAFEQMFDGIYCWNASFGYFEEEKNMAMLANVCKALKPGGSFLLDVPNRDFVVRQQPMQTWFEGDGCVCMDDMQVDFITSRLAVKRTVMLDDGRNREWLYSIRLYCLHELGKMLHEQGFKVVQVSGQVAVPDGFMGCYSPRVIILAVKPADTQKKT